MFLGRLAAWPFQQNPGKLGVAGEWVGRRTTLAEVDRGSCAICRRCAPSPAPRTFREVKFPIFYWNKSTSFHGWQPTYNHQSDWNKVCPQIIPATQRLYSVWTKCLDPVRGRLAGVAHELGSGWCQGCPRSTVLGSLSYTQEEETPAIWQSATMQIAYLMHVFVTSNGTFL